MTLFSGTRQSLGSKWQAFSRWLGELQSRFLLFLLYFLGIAPTSIIVKLFVDPLGVKNRSGPTWRRIKTDPQDFIAGSRRQF
jgi:hypothetical protein